MKKIMLALGLGGWAVAGVALGASSASAHQPKPPAWLAVYSQRPLTACGGGLGVIVFSRPFFVQQAIVCKDGQVFVSP